MAGVGVIVGLGLIEISDIDAIATILVYLAQ
jgi:hypothetical protein